MIAVWGQSWRRTRIHSTTQESFRMGQKHQCRPKNLAIADPSPDPVLIKRTTPPLGVPPSPIGQDRVKSLNPHNASHVPRAAREHLSQSIATNPLESLGIRLVRLDTERTRLLRASLARIANLCWKGKIATILNLTKTSSALRAMTTDLSPENQRDPRARVFLILSDPTTRNFLKTVTPSSSAKPWADRSTQPRKRRARCRLSGAMKKGQTRSQIRMKTPWISPRRGS
mmetsp:Transcript_7499/g.11834  ORF Transcript_7499/g.11834 Transcript_7499/m.11834 type:complete len:228 (+) Transcript_7499:660-1343(+)